MIPNNLDYYNNLLLLIDSLSNLTFDNRYFIYRNLVLKLEELIIAYPAIIESILYEI